MDKLEMVIKGLECCIDDTARADKCWENGDYPECPYNHDVDRCMDRLDRDAIALLKEQAEEIKGLRLLAEWAIDCDFGFDNIPEYYKTYKDEISNMGYTEGLIYIAKEVAKRG